jgi:hypothetical protein
MERVPGSIGPMKLLFLRRKVAPCEVKTGEDAARGGILWQQPKVLLQGAMILNQ